MFINLKLFSVTKFHAKLPWNSSTYVMKLSKGKPAQLVKLEFEVCMTLGFNCMSWFMMRSTFGSNSSKEKWWVKGLHIWCVLSHEILCFWEGKKRDKAGKYVLVLINCRNAIYLDSSNNKLYHGCTNQNLWYITLIV